MPRDRRVETRLTRLLWLMVILLCGLMLWWANSPPGMGRIAWAAVYFTALGIVPFAANWVFLYAGRIAIETEVYKAPALVLRGRAAVRGGQRLILCGRCLVLLGWGLLGIILLGGLLWGR
ncbi:MAG TPA: hypothetical protein VLH58_13340 [Candidatus Methylomirabilis sp.]|nr:hypothetical protein [Candidatus Methylomirabilis sp.]HSC72336.1 hypothetical protein [Candidatus Methylomirabilis sp.]